MTERISSPACFQRLVFATLACAALVACFDREKITPAAQPPDADMEDVPVVPPQPTEPPPTLVFEGGDIAGLQADDHRVYWVDRGTFDALGNYNGDGSLRAMPIGGGAVDVLADDLPHPYGLAITPAYAYVALERVVLPGEVAWGIGRLPLDGGPLEVLATGEAWRSADPYSHGSRVFFDGQFVQLSYVDDHSTVITPLEDMPSCQFVLGHEQHIYFVCGYSGVCRIPIDGGPCETVVVGGEHQYGGFGIENDRFIGVNNATNGSTYVSTNGFFEVPSRLGVLGFRADAAIFERAFYVMGFSTESGVSFHVADVDDPTALITLGAYPKLTWVWLPTRVGVYFLGYSGPASNGWVTKYTQVLHFPSAPAQ